MELIAKLQRGALINIFHTLLPLIPATIYEIHITILIFLMCLMGTLRD